MSIDYASISAVMDQYMKGELGLDAAAEAIYALTGGKGGLSFGYDTLSSSEAEKMEALFGRLFWLGMKEAYPDVPPPPPYGAKEFRMLQKELGDGPPEP